MSSRRKRNKKWIWGVVFAVLVIIAAVIVYLVWDGYFRDKSTPEPEPGTTDVVEVVEEKEATAETEDVSKEAASKAEVKYEEEQVYNELTGVVTYAGVSGETLMVRVNIDQYVPSGTCEMVLSSASGSIYSDTAAIVDAAATATCEGFNVPVTKLPSGGLGIVIYLSSGDKTGEIRGSVSL